MEGIQSSGGMQQIARMLMQGTSGGGAPPKLEDLKGLPPPASAQITNEKGETLLDIRDEIQSAVSEALENNADSEDLKSVVDEAIAGVLREHGFDPAEVKEAMQTDMENMPHPGGAGFGEFPGAASGLDPASLLAKGDSSEDFVQAFLEQFRAGTNLDVIS